MSSAIAGAYGAVIALLVAVAHDQLFRKILNWPESAALTGAVVVGILFLITYELLRGSKTIARKLSPITKVEGSWMITLTNNIDRPTSLCKIRFTHRDHVYNGYGINSDGTLATEWSSRDLHYDQAQDELSFTADATVMSTGKRIRNYGYIKFSKDARGVFTYGNGYFVDMADQLTQTHMTLSRIQDKKYDELVTRCFEKTQLPCATVAEASVP